MKVAIAIALLTWAGAAQAQQINPDQAAYDINKNAVMLSEILKGQAQQVSALQAQLKQAQETAADNAKQVADLKAAAAKVDCTAPDQKAAPKVRPDDKP